MSDLLARLKGVFVAPAEAGAAARARATPPEVALPATKPVPPPVQVVLLAPAAALPAASGALALALAGAVGARAALACSWVGGPNRVTVPATRSARRLAMRLTGRGFGAAATGRLARLDLPDAPEEGAAAAARATAADLAAGAPSVVALAGPRCSEVDVLLDAADLVVIAVPAEAPEALVRAGVRSLGSRAAPVVVWALGAGPIERALSTAGVAAGPSVRRALELALPAVGVAATGAVTA